MAFKKSVRQAVPLLTSVSGPSGSGKTLGALLLAAGMVGPRGRVGFIDTENRRGTLYADSTLVMKALPDGYDIDQLDPDYSPARYREKIIEAEKAGITVCVVDSFSHEWEGTGGCTDIAEKRKLGKMDNWAAAKLEHKKLVNYLLTSNMHLIFCLRARDKVKIAKINGKDEVIPIGIQPITEKNFVFEMLVSLAVDEKTHLSTPIKVPDMLASVFPVSGELLTKEHGERIRQWNESAPAADTSEQLRKRARLAAADGMDSYKEFFGGLSAAQRKALASVHEENKMAAEQADMLHEEQGDAEPEPEDDFMAVGR